MSKTRMERRNAGTEAEAPYEDTDRSRRRRRRNGSRETVSSENENNREEASRRSRYSGKEKEPEEEEAPMLTLPHTLLAAFIFIVIAALASPFIMSMFQ